MELDSTAPELIHEVKTEVDSEYVIEDSPDGITPSPMTTEDEEESSGGDLLVILLLCNL